MSCNVPPKKQLLTTEPHSFPFVFGVCLCSVEQTNHIHVIAKCRAQSLFLALGALVRPGVICRRTAEILGAEFKILGAQLQIPVAPSPNAQKRATLASCCSMGLF